MASFVEEGICSVLNPESNFLVKLTKSPDKSMHRVMCHSSLVRLKPFSLGKKRSKSVDASAISLYETKRTEHQKKFELMTTGLSNDNYHRVKLNTLNDPGGDEAYFVIRGAVAVSYTRFIHEDFYHSPIYLHPLNHHLPV